ncbi:MAG TPA: M48 family metallopeptidase [Thermodesulfobacteriota bacterium]|nr:M48 family metallopeptidase [Thermodesulfobacteriota bacterium]HNU71384.1 M48 family metallopeptidase [Thermodesulfobacteriota bacterium]
MIDCCKSILLLILIALVGCAAPKTVAPTFTEEALREEQHLQRCLILEERRFLENRLANVSFRVSSAAVEMAPRQKNVDGLRIIHKTFFAAEDQEAAAEVYGLGEDFEIDSVIPGSPAQEAGIQAGDVVVSIDGCALPHSASDFKATLKRLRQDGLLRVALRREDEPLTVEIKTIRSAGYRVRIGNPVGSPDVVNAYADGENIYITPGMMRFTTDDDELAMVVSHELAHNIRQHQSMVKRNTLIAGLLGAVVDVAFTVFGGFTGGEFTKIGIQKGEQAYTKDIEREADYVGLYILANAGYDIHSGPDFFRRFATAHPRSAETKYAKSHPSTPERFLMLNETIKEIECKQRSGVPLLPEEKK